MDKAKKEPKEQSEKRDYKTRVDRERPRRSEKQPASHEAFRGKHKDLAGWVYVYDSAARSYQYTKTTEAIADWVQVNMRNPTDIRNLIMKLESPDQKKWIPKKPVEIEDEETRQMIFSGEIKKYLKRKDDFENNKSNLFGIVIGQCNESMMSKLKSQDGWQDIEHENDLLKLMKRIKVWMLNTEGSRSPTASAYSAMQALFKLRQNRYESLEEYRKRFTAATEVLEHVDIQIQKSLVGLTDSLLKSEGNTRTLATPAILKDAEKKVLKKFMAYSFIAAADKVRFGNIIVYLENEFVAGSDKFPDDVTAAYNYLENLKRGANHVDTSANDGVSFAQQGQTKQRNNTRDRSHIQCRRCGVFGHKQFEGKCKPEDIERWQQQKAQENQCGTSSHMSSTTNHCNHDHDEEDSEDEYYQPPSLWGSIHVTSDCDSTNTGHITNEAGETTESVMTNSFNSRRAYVIPRGSVGLDSMSSVDVFGERSMLSNIRTVSQKMTIVCNAGAVLVTQMGDLEGYGPVWYHRDAIANILSLSNVQKRFRVRYDSQAGDYFTIIRDDGTERIFRPTKKGLYVSRIAAPRAKVKKSQVALVNTVDGNKREFTRREVKKATEARKLMSIIGRPSESHMLKIIGDRHLHNCDIREQDVRNALAIFGPDLGSLKGKTTRRREPHVMLETQPIPQAVMQRHRQVVVAFDVMYVNEIAFAVSISRAIKFGTAEAIANRKAETLLTSLRHIQATYAKRGFRVVTVAGDNEFATLEGPLSNAGMTLNVVSAEEHVPEVERFIRTLKERCRAVYNTLPFKRLPNRMVVELVYAMNFWLHAFPARDGVCSHISPRELITGMALDAKKHCVISFGTYVQTHEPHDNTMASRTIGAIALRPSGNAQGGHYFYSLATGRLIVRNNWTELPMPADVIARVEALAENKALNRLAFGDRRNIEQELDDHDEVISIPSGSDGDGNTEDDSDGNDEDDATNEEYADDPFSHAPDPKDMPHAPDFNNQAKDVRVKVEPGERDAGGGERQSTNTHEGDAVEPDVERRSDTHRDQSSEGHDEPEPQGEPHADNASTDNAIAPYRPAEGEANDAQRESAGVRQDAGVPTDAAATPNHAPTGAPQRERPQRIRKPSRRAIEARQYEEEAEQEDDNEGANEGGEERRGEKATKTKRNSRGYLMAQMNTNVAAPHFDAAHLSNASPALYPLMETLMTQYGIKKGLQIFGKDGDEAVSKEMQQLHDLDVLQPKPPTALNHNQKRSALQYLMFLKQKRDGRIKGRGCADGRKQRADAVKGEASSPTISTEAVFLILTIAAKEGRNVMVMDIPGAFLQTELKGEEVHVRFVGRMAELLVMIDPKLYRPNIIVENGKPVLYAQLKRALYGMLQSALRFWEQVLEDLTELGFEVNPYDWCVANRTVNGTQQTVGWHVDDFLISHKDQRANEELANWFNTKYGQRTPVTIRQGKEHDYLGMRVSFATPGKVQITMYDYINQLIDEAPSEFSGTAPTPAARHLFDTDEGAPKLNEEQAAKFHHLVAKALFLAKRARPDIQLPVAFLCTRVQGSDIHDWKKLGRVIRYLRGSKELPLTLEADEQHIIKWWVDSAFAVAQDMRSQSGGTMTLGKGSVYSSSTRQRLNTISSTEAELVGANDFMPQILWTRYFLQAQGYDVRDNILHQDNQSAILLETNGKGSSSKRTRHINIRYYFICDRVASGELSVKFCPTADMLGDFFTKPLQGAPFQKMRDLVLNIKA